MFSNSGNWANFSVSDDNMVRDSMNLSLRILSQMTTPLLSRLTSQKTFSVSGDLFRGADALRNPKGEGSLVGNIVV